MRPVPPIEILQTQGYKITGMRATQYSFVKAIGDVFWLALKILFYAIFGVFILTYLVISKAGIFKR